MIVYLDSSALLKILFREPDHLKIGNFLEKAREIVSSSLLEAEIMAAIKRENLDFESAFAWIDSVKLIQPNRSLKPELKKILSLGYLRGADALHLATALFISPKAKDLFFLCCDQKLSHMAGLLGFKTV